MEKKSWVPWLFFFMGTVAIVGVLFSLVPHWTYYLLPMNERPLNADHPLLRPSGYAGLSFGIVGTALIFLNLSYLIRKRLIHFRWLGQLRTWMSFHVMTGLVGGTLILLHSAFHPRSALASTAMFGLLVVIVTGLVGRYIYAHTPRSLEGKELELEDIKRRLEQYRAALTRMGVPLNLFDKSSQPLRVQGSDSNFFQSIWGMVVGDRELRQQLHHLKYSVHASPGLRPLANQILPLGKRYERERQWMARYGELRALMGGWRFLHRWFAIILLAMALFHVLIAARMGNLWMFNR